MPSSGKDKPPATKTAFDGEEPTEVMAPRPVSKPPPPEPEPENKDKQYFAPAALAAPRVPDKQMEGAKIVLNIPDTNKVRGVAEERAKRRAPTVKIARAAIVDASHPLAPTQVDPPKADSRRPIAPTLNDMPVVKLPLPPRTPPAPKEPQARAVPPAAPSPPPARKPLSEELTVPDQAAIRIPIDVTVDDADFITEVQASRITPAQPISDAPPPRPFDFDSSRPPSGRTNEPPATAVPLSPPKPERSRAPWLVLAVLALGGVGAAVVFVTQRKPPAEETPKTVSIAAQAAGGTATASTSVATTGSAAVTAEAVATASATESAEPSATAVASAPATQSPTIASIPPRGAPPRPVATPIRTSAAAPPPVGRPTAPVRPPPGKDPLMPSGI